MRDFPGLDRTMRLSGMLRSEEDEDVEVFFDVVEFMGDFSGNVEDRSGLGRIIPIAGGEATAAGDDVVDLVFEMRRLQVLGAGREVIESQAHFRNGQKLKVAVVLCGVGSFDLGQGKRG